MWRDRSSNFALFFFVVVVDQIGSRLMFCVLLVLHVTPFIIQLTICMWISDITCVHRLTYMWTAYVVMFITVGSVMRVDNLHLIVLCFVLS